MSESGTAGFMNQYSHHLFADAGAECHDAGYVIFGVPYDGTTSFRSGARRGPRAIRDLSYNFESYLPECSIDLADVLFTDIGDIDPFCMPEMVVDQVRDTVAEIAAEGRIPVMLGGEHSITTGAVRALSPDCYVVCDAHLDLRDAFRGSPYNHACTARRVYEEGIEEICIIGARSGTREEYAFAEDLCVYSADDVRRDGIRSVIDEIRSRLEGKKVYLSVDADAIDCCLTPGVGTPEPFGLTPEDVRDVIAALAPLAAGFDYVEVCPIDAGQTAAVAARCVRTFITSHWSGSQG